MDAPFSYYGTGQYKVLRTEDGINTVFSEVFKANYHSVHGALDESNSIFIKLGFDFLVERNLTKIRIFEMGFGTGLNAILTYIAAEKHKISVRYDGIEAYPLPIEVVNELGYDQFLDILNLKVWNEMHQLPTGVWQDLSPGFKFRKTIGQVEEVSEAEYADLIYYDAFAPSIQPSLWEKEMMQKMYDMLVPGGILVTYCAKGAFKRTLKEVGFKIEGHPGPGRKREITRALKPNI